MEFNNLELEYLELFKEVNSDFSIRMTPKFNLNKSIVEDRFLKMSDSLKRKGYEFKGYIVEDKGFDSRGFHYHSNMSVLKGGKEEFKVEFKNIIDRFSFNGWIEDYEGGYEEYMVSKLRISNYWVGLWGI